MTRGRTGLVVGVVAAVVGGLVVATVVAAISVVLLRRGSAPVSGPAPRGRTELTVRVVGKGDRAQVERVRDQLVKRAGAAGFRDPAAVLQGDDTIMLSVAGTTVGEDLKRLVVRGELRFRRIVSSTMDSSTGVDAPSATGPVALSAVIAKLGPVYEAARGLRDPAQADPAALAAFGTLSPAEVAVLPAQMQYAVPTITCRQLDARPAGAVSAAGERVAACAGQPGGGREKFLLDVAAVTDTDVREARAANSESGWAVTVTFTGAGQARWTGLTREVTSGDPNARRVAIVVDNAVVSAPAIMAVIPGDAMIAGSFTEVQVRALAAQLGSGALPLDLAVVSMRVRD
jgi:preprotein translocase subunit SecD